MQSANAHVSKVQKPMPHPAPRGYGPRRAFLQSSAALLLGVLAWASASAATEAPLKIVAFGDSLVAGYGLAADAAFPSVLQEKLQEQGYNVTLVNAGVSGDTTTAGLARLDWTLAGGADGVILELGANDMLRGIDPRVTKAALDRILARLKARHVKVLIAGMKATPSLGPEYKMHFDSIYPDLAKKYGAPLYPFFLDGVAGTPALELPDHLHPNPAGVERIVAGILPSVHSFLERLGEKAAPNQKE